MPGPGCWSVSVAAVFILAVAVSQVRGGLYSPDEPLVSLAGATRSLLLGSNSSWLAEFYASWCGHCAAFRPTWSALARDVQDWRPAVYLAVLDCAEESNRDTCNEFGVTGYPTVQFFKAFAGSPSEGVRVPASSVQEIRQHIIDRLEEQKESPPPACPPLEPISAPKLEQFFANNNETYLAVIFEDAKMYMGREVALDMVQYEGVSVRRVVKDQTDLVEKFNVSSFPAGFLISKNGSTSRINLGEETRSAYTKFLRSLPGVQRGKHSLIGWSETSLDTYIFSILFSSAKVYMADLESALHYSLRVEVARFATLDGERLKALSNFINVLRKYFPARPYLRTLLNSANSWLRARAKTKVSYKDFEDVLNNKNQAQKAVLSSDVRYVGCQGSKPQFRGFPCSLWTLFHVLTVQASEVATLGRIRPGKCSQNTFSYEVLLAMRGYVQHFFGCRECAQHFERMAQESMRNVRSLDEAIVWLWERHNRVNKRLAGAQSEDPAFPKVQWPTAALCPLCQSKADMSWNLPSVLDFLKAHFGKKNLADEYLEDEEVLLEKQKKAHNATQKRDKRDVTDEEKKSEIIQNRDDTENTRDDPREDDDEEKSDAYDKNSYGPNMFLSRSLKDSSLHKGNHALHPKTLVEPRDAEFDEAAVRDRLLKRGVDANYPIGVVVERGEVNRKGRWVKMLEVGFSCLDISLCVVLYFLSSMCLLAMYLYMSLRTRCPRQRCSYLPV
ncbi:sulfhydryl oxidase 1-like [Spea bombifrons]|uniref:sulfhydryl oxidase 1-like n=1 Tax=Spea bombifrons TaxID=233779 RepID=UPI0023490340|nr:sulfhydryl oxidase 1-like [Spea bombifrons]